MNVYLKWTLTLLSLAGAFLVAEQSRYGFACWILANVGWSVDAWRRKDWAMLALWVCYLGTAVYGWAKWTSSML